MNINSPLTAGVIAGLLAICYGTANFLAGEISTSAFLIALFFFGGCTALFVRYARKLFINAGKTNLILRLSIIAATFVIFFSVSSIDYLATGRLLGTVMGGLAGAMLCSRTSGKEKLASNWIIAHVIIGVITFVFLRSFTIDILTMSSVSLEPKVHKGQKILVNYLSFGLCIPFSPYQVAHWGNPRVGDFVIVNGPKARPYLREVLDINEKQVLVNIDGWLPRGELMAKAKPL